MASSLSDNSHHLSMFIRDPGRKTSGVYPFRDASMCHLDELTKTQSFISFREARAIR